MKRREFLGLSLMQTAGAIPAFGYDTLLVNVKAPVFPGREFSMAR
jgi:hypothetical protein